ncbi:nuclear pore complex protein NUP1 [Rosa rugosa]|uniref:nuclear pore complex protein NUP1 n=1 Tax=Rosa rugosa TaxID=74645 RepID=UPI002B41799E|nr:nuclear pore complex protein NUP1 [Rosa rugosa]
MATAAREEKQQPYESLGTGGKFRKTPFRRTTQTTPYDRPSTALRNPSTANGGWISKLVDPAQRLLTYSAHRLFSTVFNKRLPPPPPSTEPNHEARIMDKEEVGMDPPGVQKGAIEQSTDPRSTSAGDGFTSVEQILMQKTFTRPEIDRLKELLHSRTDDIPIENQEKRSEVLPSMAVVSHDREEFAKTPLQDKSANSHLVSTPVVSTTVLDEDVASPVELAKAYMGSRPSKVSPSMLGLRSQALYEDSHISSSVTFPSKSPLMSVVPRFSSNGAAPENGFATPRSRGRSAIHSMARTPYSRVQTRSTFKGVGSTVDTYGVPSSSSQSIWEQSQPSGSKQGALKRRFSVLDNDIGSIGPIRRIRPKPNLLSSRGLSSPISTEVFQNPSSSTRRPLLLGQPKHTLAKASSENGDNAVPSTSFSTVPSQSSKAASKIFEHLDKITSPKEKSSEPKILTVRDRSPTKLSPSMLRGQALKSLEDVDTSKFLENARYNNGNNLDVSSNQRIPDVTSQKHDKVKENGPSRIAAPCDSSTTFANEVESRTEKDVVIKVKAAVSAASNTVAHPSEKKRAFKMSAHEYLELDDDDYSNNGHASGSIADGRVKVDKIAAAKPEKPVASTEVKPPASFAINQKPDSGTSDGVYTVAPGATDTVPKPVESDKADENNSDVEVPFRVPETLVSSSSSATTSIFSTTSQVSNNLASQSSLGSMAPTANTNSGNNIAAASAVTTSGSNRFSSVSAPSFSAEPFFKFSVSTTTEVTQVPENSSLESLGDKNKRDGSFANLSGTSFAGTSAISAGTGSSFLGVSAAASSPAATNQLGSTSFSSGSGFGPSAQASPGLSFKFEPSTASTAVTPGSSSLEFLNDKNKQGGIFGSLSSTSSAGTSTTSASTLSNSSGFSAAASTPIFTSQSVGSALFSGGSGTSSSAHVSPAGTGAASFTQSAPVQPGSSASSSVFNFAGNTAFSSGSSALGSSTPSSEANPSSSSTAPSTVFGSGWQPATSSSTPSSEANPSSSSTAPSTVFGSGWQPATSSKFASTLNSTSFSPAFQFGASSASAATNTTSTSFGASSTSAATSNSAATVFGMPSTSAPTSNSLPTLFGASTVSSPSTNSASVFGLSNGASSTGMFPFTSSATTTTPSQPAFGNSNSIFGFSTAPSGNNDQMSMEDSMAEDSMAASPPTVAVFGQQPSSTTQSTPTFPVFGQQPVSTPQSPFVFGGSSSSNGFQFQSQPNQSNSQNPPLFQGSNSLANSQNPAPFQDSLGLTSNSFSLGAADKSNRRIVRVNRSKNRKK